MSKVERVKKYRKEGGLLSKWVEYDAEEYYKSKIEYKSKEIKDMKLKRMRENCGYAFVSFASNLQVKRVT